MRPSKLKPGAVVLCNGREMTFVKRIRTVGPAVNIFQCKDYVGLHGPNDKGLCEMTDVYAARSLELKRGGL